MKDKLSIKIDEDASSRELDNVNMVSTQLGSRSPFFQLGRSKSEAATLEGFASDVISGDINATRDVLKNTSVAPLLVAEAQGLESLFHGPHNLTQRSFGYSNAHPLVPEQQRAMDAFLNAREESCAVLLDNLDSQDGDNQNHDDEAVARSQLPGSNPG